MSKVETLHLFHDSLVRQIEQNSILSYTIGSILKSLVRFNTLNSIAISYLDQIEFDSVTPTKRKKRVVWKRFPVLLSDGLFSELCGEILPTKSLPMTQGGWVKTLEYKTTALRYSSIRP